MTLAGKNMLLYSRVVIYIYIYIYIGLFISPSGISDLCGTVTGMVTPKGSMLTLRLLMSYMYIYIYIYIILVA